jgi:hypothetical protein
MKHLLFIALALAAPAYAQDSDDDTVSPEQATALQTYFACIYQEVAANDDGVSDPASLTPKVAPTCRYLLGTAATIFANGDPVQRDIWYKKWLALEETQVARTVWALRVDRRASGESANPVTAATAPEPHPAPVQMASAGTNATKAAAARPRAVTATATDDKPMSEWRRTYIAKHGHEPPVAAK